MKRTTVQADGKRLECVRYTRKRKIKRTAVDFLAGGAVGAIITVIYFLAVMFD